MHMRGFFNASQMNRAARRFLTVFAIGAAASLACYTVAGASLDLPLGGVLFAAILAPALASNQMRTNAITSIAFAIGVAAIWLVLPEGWFVSSLVLLSFTAAAVFGS